MSQENKLVVGAYSIPGISVGLLCKKSPDTETVQMIHQNQQESNYKLSPNGWKIYSDIQDISLDENGVPIITTIKDYHGNFRESYKPDSDLGQVMDTLLLEATGSTPERLAEKRENLGRPAEGVISLEEHFRRDYEQKTYGNARQ